MSRPSTRRRFLRQIALGSAGLAAAPLAPRRGGEAGWASLHAAGPGEAPTRDALRRTLPGLADEAFFASIDEEADKVGETVRTQCRNMPDPEPLDIFHEVYAEPNVHIDQQRAEFADYLSSFEGAGAEGGR